MTSVFWIRLFESARYLEVFVRQGTILGYNAQYLVVFVRQGIISGHNARYLAVFVRQGIISGHNARYLVVFVRQGIISGHNARYLVVFVRLHLTALALLTPNSTILHIHDFCIYNFCKCCLIDELGEDAMLCWV